LPVFFVQYMRQRVTQSVKKTMSAMGSPKDIQELKVMGSCSG
jgi:hypothetical protein